MYQIIFSRSAEKEIESLPKLVLKRVVKAIDLLAEEPRPHLSKKLKGSDNLWRIRVGDYRIIYNIYDAISIIDIRKIGHRKDVYE